MKSVLINSKKNYKKYVSYSVFLLKLLHFWKCSSDSLKFLHFNVTILVCLKLLEFDIHVSITYALLHFHSVKGTRAFRIDDKRTRVPYDQPLRYWMAVQVRNAPTWSAILERGDCRDSSTKEVAAQTNSAGQSDYARKVTEDRISVWNRTLSETFQTLEKQYGDSD